MADYDAEELKAKFLAASSRVKEIASSLSEEHLLQFYGYYKQAVEGPCFKPKPSWYQMQEKQKWQSWSSLSNMSSEEAMDKYVSLLSVVDGNWESAPAEKAPSWVHHSLMQNTDEVLLDSEKTVTDWVKEGNFENVVLSLGGGEACDVNALDKDGLSLLHWAADRGKLEVVKYLIQNVNADVNLRDEQGQTALHYASSCGHRDVVEFLISSGADPHIKDKDDETAMSVASSAEIRNILTAFEKSQGAGCAQILT